jgi:hypothetical protein
MNLTNDYNKCFILITLLNIIYMFNMDYNNISLLILLNSLSINAIMFRDVYFETKYH